MKNSSKIAVIIIAVAFVGGLMYYFLGSRQIPSPGTITGNNGSAGTTTQNSNSITYRNEKYGFSIDVPKSWSGYSVVENKWSGDSLNSKGNLVLGTVSGPMISIRHPEWSTTTPRQDIPVMVLQLISGTK